MLRTAPQIASFCGYLLPSLLPTFRRPLPTFASGGSGLQWVTRGLESEPAGVRTHHLLCSMRHPIVILSSPHPHGLSSMTSADSISGSPLTLLAVRHAFACAILLLRFSTLTEPADEADGGAAAYPACSQPSRFKSPRSFSHASQAPRRYSASIATLIASSSSAVIEKFFCDET